MVTILAFLVAIAVLVAVHEWGHFQMARWCGVKVLKFSVGFGPRLAGWTSPRSGTEYAISALPLGGYVRMLDEAEGPVAPELRHMAFNAQSLVKRAAIVSAGPAANLLLAIALYAIVYFVGAPEPVARIASPPTGTLLAKAGLVGGETILRLTHGDEPAIAIESFEDLRWRVAKAALEGDAVRLEFSRSDVTGTQGRVESAQIELDSLVTKDADEALLRAVGLVAPYSPAVIGTLVSGGAAQSAGLQTGDRVLQVEQITVTDGAHLRQLIRSGAGVGIGQVQHWQIQRSGKTLALDIRPKVETEAGSLIGRIGAVVGGAPDMRKVRAGVVGSLSKAMAKTWDVSALTVKMLGRMLVGEASLKSISGPITIADYAGRSAALGWLQFLQFLALISVSLGALNLLPLPVLDGGHLMYYLWEGSTGRAVSEHWQALLQRAGVTVLMLLMSLAVYNDVVRLMQ